MQRCAGGREPVVAVGRTVGGNGTAMNQVSNPQVTACARAKIQQCGGARALTIRTRNVTRFQAADRASAQCHQAV